MRIFSHAVIGLLWVLHWLPLPVLARLGRGFGGLLYFFGKARRHVVKVNLRLCFPELDESQRDDLARRHYAVLGRSALERGVAWWASEARLRRLVKVEHLERLRAIQAQGRPIVLLVPHFVGLDMCGTRMAMEFDGMSVYAHQKDPVFDRWLLHGRTRFGDQVMLSRSDGVRTTVRAMRTGRSLYYLPDMDFGRKDSIFVPFFGVPAATITGLSRLARLADAAVVPSMSRMLADGSGYVMEIGEEWVGFPTGDVEADTAYMNAWIESAVRTMPEQYYWVHRRFKTRPEGVPSPY